MWKVPLHCRDDIGGTIRRLAHYLNDPEPQIRRELGQVIQFVVARDCKEFPIELAPVLKHSDPDVRQTAVIGIASVKPFPKQYIPLLIEATKSRNIAVRREAPIAIGKAVGNTPEARAVIEPMFKDEELSVRHNAHVAHFRSTDDMAEWVPHLLKMTANRPPRPRDPTPKEKQHGDLQKLLAIACVFEIYNLVQTRADEVAKHLLDNIDHKDLEIQLCALRQLRAMCISSKASFRALERQKPRGRLTRLELRSRNEKVQAWAWWVADLLRKGIPADLPDSLNPIYMYPASAEKP